MWSRSAFYVGFCGLWALAILIGGAGIASRVPAKVVNSAAARDALLANTLPRSVDVTTMTAEELRVLLLAQQKQLDLLRDDLLSSRRTQTTESPVFLSVDTWTALGVVLSAVLCWLAFRQEVRENRRQKQEIARLNQPLIIRP